MQSDIRLDQYRIFDAVAREQSFSAGAKRLFLTQSAVSQTIRQMEDSLGTPLFFRGARGVTLTEAGKMLHEYVRTSLDLLETARNRLHRMQQLDEGELKIGAGDTISSYFLLPFLERFHQLYPGVRLQVVNRTSRDVAALVRSGGLDIGFVNLPLEQEEKLLFQPCFAVQDIFVAGSRFTKYRDHPLSRKELSALPLILLEQKANSRQYIDKEFLRSGITLQPEIELGAHELLLQFAQINLGVCCVIREFSEAYLRRGDVFELIQAEPLPPRNVGCCFLKDIPLSPAGEKFMEILGE